MNNIVEWIPAAGAVAGALLTFKKVWRWMARYADRVKCMFQPKACPALQSDLSAMMAQINAITAELRPNGGSSLRDSINRIEQCQKEISTRQLISDQRQRAILSDMNFGVLETDASGNCIWANRWAISKWCK